MPTKEPLSGEKLGALLDRMPSSSGVYLMKDLQDRVIYVGKAKNLSKRVRSYFRQSADNRYFISRLPGLLGDIETVITNSEKEALILERELVRHYRPRFNIDLKDNKNFLSIHISHHQSFPRLSLARRPPTAKQPGRWFGPYTSASQARHFFKILQSTFQLRICRNTVFSRRTRPCLQYQMGRCLGPCTLEITADFYAHRVEQSIRVLQGRTQTLLDELQKQMKTASSELRFEDAARLRDRIRAVEDSMEKQQIIDEKDYDRDVLGFYREGTCGAIALMQIRCGRWLGASRYPFKNIESTDFDIMRQFIHQHYGSGADLPPEILLADEATIGMESSDDLEVLADILSELRKGPVKLSIPKRGKGAGLVKTAQENARQAFQQALATETILIERLERLKNRLDLSRIPRRIECFDLSTLGGRHSVGAMAVLLDGEPLPSRYRRYRIRNAKPDSDVSMMREVITRRFRPLLEGSEAGPDLVVLDGGLGQLGVVQALFSDLGVTNVDLVALSKGRMTSKKLPRKTERVYVPNRKNPVPIKPGSDELYLLGLVRDEAHRFAVGYHRKLRKKDVFKSKLNNINGVGPVLQRKLLARFKNITGIQHASIEELASIPGISANLAERIQKQIQCLTIRSGPAMDDLQKRREERH